VLQSGNCICKSMIVTKTSSADLTLLDQQSLAHGLELLARGHSFEAHECFEHVFSIREGRARTLFRALSQLAAAYYQLSLGRARAARSTWHKASRNLALVDSLSVEFQQRVEDLFSAAGAGDGCERLIDPRLISGLTEWPVPDTLRQAP
jgi:hypothetical protein